MKYQWGQWPGKKPVFYTAKNIQFLTSPPETQLLKTGGWKGIVLIFAEQKTTQVRAQEKKLNLNIEANQCSPKSSEKSKKRNTEFWHLRKQKHQNLYSSLSATEVILSKCGTYGKNN